MGFNLLNKALITDYDEALNKRERLALIFEEIINQPLEHNHSPSFLFGELFRRCDI